VDILASIVCGCGGCIFVKFQPGCVVVEGNNVEGAVVVVVGNPGLNNPVLVVVVLGNPVLNNPVPVIPGLNNPVLVPGVVVLG
jgi:hypothetical protein